MIHYQTIEPHPSLRDFVRFFWILECEIAQNDHYIHRSVADGCTEFLFHYKGQFEEIIENKLPEKSFLSGIHGQTCHFRRFKIDKSFGIFGSYLYPFTIPYLFNIPASELTNTMTNLHCFLGQAGKDLEEKMMLAQTNKERVDIMTSFFHARLKNITNGWHPVLNSIKAVVSSNGQYNIESLSKQANLSKRQIERVFKQYAGLSPKVYSRIARFQSVFHEFQPKTLRLTDIAQKCGYYDQSHFIHDFKSFSGFSPKEFLTQNSTETAIWTL